MVANAISLYAARNVGRYFDKLTNIHALLLNVNIDQN